jgi:hypothetical protein
MVLRTVGVAVLSKQAEDEGQHVHQKTAETERDEPTKPFTRFGSRWLNCTCALR